MKRKTFDNYDYEEAFPVELDHDIQKKARKNFENFEIIFFFYCKSIYHLVIIEKRPVFDC